MLSGYAVHKENQYSTVVPNVTCHLKEQIHIRMIPQDCRNKMKTRWVTQLHSAVNRKSPAISF